MRHFEAKTGCYWAIEITEAAIERCARLAGVDIATPAGWYALGAVPGRLPAVLYALVQPTAARMGINQEEFEAAIDADAQGLRQGHERK
jgi:cobalamin biosynthesis protein CobD/CbiB